MQNGKKTARQQQAAKSKRKIAKTAIALFRKHGYNNVTINDICRKAGVSVGTFYHYFETKGAVFKPVMDDIEGGLFDYLAASGDQAAYLPAIHDFIVYFVKSHLVVEIDELTIWLSPEFRTIGESAGAKTFAALRQLIDDGQRAGEISTALPSETIAHQLFVGGKGILYDWCLHDGTYDLMQCVENYCALMLRALRPD